MVGFLTDGGEKSLGGGGASPVTIDKYGCQGFGREELGSRLVVLVYLEMDGDERYDGGCRCMRLWMIETAAEVLPAVV